MTEEHFRDFYATHIADVWSFARRRTSSAAEADDLCADTFAVAWRRRADIPVDAGRLWLFGVARRVLANHRRQTERRGRLHRRLARDAAPPISYEDAAPSETALWRALAALSAGDRELLLLRAWDDLDVAEIATVLGISAATVSSRLYKARRRLARELERRDPPAGRHVLDDDSTERSRADDRS
ncbi:sigma-70 family RNA polymerase sigma factor [Actinoplanes sp. NPDC051411]|uniref:RNA polymerase sigma factor n=1 Tax=Actinoplanes sp. NPDC051411 TaxID=3155522 RepID=UPI003427B415